MQGRPTYYYVSVSLAIINRYHCRVATLNYHEGRVAAVADREDEMTARSTVLVVDDEPGLASLYGLWLEDRYDVRTETDGRATLDALEDDVDAVLLDRQMPGISGDDVLSQVRERGCDCPVAIVSAAKPDEAFLTQPFDDYLQKPIDREDVVDAVDRLVALDGLDAATRRYARVTRKLSLVAAVWPSERRAQSDVVADLEREQTDLAPVGQQPGPELVSSDLADEAHLQSGRTDPAPRR